MPKYRFLKMLLDGDNVGRFSYEDIDTDEMNKVLYSSGLADDYYDNPHLGLMYADHAIITLKQELANMKDKLTELNVNYDKVVDEKDNFRRKVELFKNSHEELAIAYRKLQNEAHDMKLTLDRYLANDTYQCPATDDCCCCSSDEGDDDEVDVSLTEEYEQLREDANSLLDENRELISTVDILERELHDRNNELKIAQLEKDIIRLEKLSLETKLKEMEGNPYPQPSTTPSSSHDEDSYSINSTVSIESVDGKSVAEMTVLELMEAFWGNE